MGSWGTAIKSNDTFAEVYDGFLALYHEGLEVDAISRKLIDENAETIGDPDESNNFWFALASAQWECKKLDPDILERVATIIQSGTDLEVWRELDASEKDLAKRKIVLDKFLEEIRSPRPKPKTRKKKRIRKPIFAKGDCLTFKLANGNYGGAVVLESEHDTEFGSSFIVTTRINQTEKPTVKDFENAEVLVVEPGDFPHISERDGVEKICWYLPLRHKTFAHLMETVGSLEVQLNYDSDKGSFTSHFPIFIDAASRRFEKELAEGSRFKKQSFVRNLIKQKGFWATKTEFVLKRFGI